MRFRRRVAVQRGWLSQKLLSSCTLLYNAATMYVPLCVCMYTPRVWAYVTLFACVRALACFRATACQSVSRSRPSFSLSLVLVRMVVVVACVYVCVYVCACAQQLSRFHFRVLAFPSTYFSFYTAQMNIAKDIRFLFQTSRRIFVWIFSRFIW